MDIPASAGFYSGCKQTRVPHFSRCLRGASGSRLFIMQLICCLFEHSGNRANSPYPV